MCLAQIKVWTERVQQRGEEVSEHLEEPCTNVSSI